MYANRIRNWQPATHPAKKAHSVAPALVVPSGFVIAPVFLVVGQTCWQVHLYQAAYERARAAAAVPRHHRRFFSVWN